MSRPTEEEVRKAQTNENPSFINQVLDSLESEYDQLWKIYQQVLPSIMDKYIEAKWSKEMVAQKIKRVNASGLRWWEFELTWYDLIHQLYSEMYRFRVFNLHYFGLRQEYKQYKNAFRHPFLFESNQHLLEICSHSKGCQDLLAFLKECQCETAIKPKYEGTVKIYVSW